MPQPTHGSLAPTVLADFADLADLPPLPPAISPPGARDTRDTALAALVVGLTGDLLLRATPWGVNAPLATLTLVLVLAGLARRDGRTLTTGAALLAALALAFAGALAWRDSAVLAALNLLALGTTLCALAAAVLHGDALPIDRAGPFAYLAGVARTGVGVLSGASGVATRVVRGAAAPASGGALGGVGAVGRGAVLAAPVLLVFGLLLASADRTFARLVDRLTAW